MTDPARGARERGVTLQQQGMSARAITFLERALGVDPNDARAAAYLASALDDLSRPEEALVAIERSLAADPRYVWAHLLRSVILNSLHRDDEALEAALEARRLAPRSTGSHARVAWCLHLMERDAEALEAAQKAVELDPGSVGSWNARGFAALRLNNPSLARESFTKAAELDPLAGMAGLASVETGEAAPDLLRRVLASNATDHITHGNLVLKLCRLGKWEEAFVLARLLVEQKPDYTLGLEVYVRSAVNSGRLDRAIEMEDRLLQRADELEGTRDEYRAYEGLGHIALARGDARAAESRYGRALELKDWCCLAVGVGRAAAARGDRVKAEAMYRRAAARNRCDASCSLITMLAEELSAAK